MTPAFWLCLLLVIASGLSAYIGNEWGRKIGKRKLSIFRMRPKHSSTFLTVLLSMCLSLGLMGVLLISTPALQQALFTPATPPQTLTDYQDALALANTQIQRLSQKNKSTEAPTASADAMDAPLSAAAPPVPPSGRVSTGSDTAVPSQPQVQKPSTRSVAPLRLAQRTPPKATAPAKPAPQKMQMPTREIQPRLSSRRPLRSVDVTPSPASTMSAVPASTPAPESSAPQAIAALPVYPTGPLFALTVNGELTPQESQQLNAGIQRLTQNYLQLLGIQSEALQWAPTQLAQEMTKLKSTGQYRLEVTLQTQREATKVPVYVAVQALNNVEDEDFDPQTLLENQRLNPVKNRQSLQNDLQTVLQQHAQQQLALQSPDSARPLRLRTVQLPFEILNLENSNGTITGELFLR